MLLVISMMHLSCGKVTYHNYLKYFNQEEPGIAPEIFAPGIVSVKGRFEMGFSISPDGRSIAFGTADEKNLENNTIYLMDFSDGKWNNSVRNIFPDNVNVFFPMFGPDGDELFFAKSVNGAETDIWIAVYKAKEIEGTKQLTATSSPAREAGHGKSISGSIYFTSNRDINSPCCGDIYYAEMDRNKHYSTVHKVNELSSEGDEESLYVSPKEDFMIIQAWKRNSRTKHDLYLSYRNKYGTWSMPERLDSTINTKEIEQRPFVSPDKKYLFFSRTSTIQNAIDSEIYWVSTKSVFKPYLYNAPPKIEVAYQSSFSVKFYKDLFKHVNNLGLLYEVTFKDGSKLPEWLTFDAETLTLSGTWNDKKVDSIYISATDINSNKSILAIPVVIK
jgi:hypothetical protein